MASVTCGGGSGWNGGGAAGDDGVASVGATPPRRRPEAIGESKPGGLVGRLRRGGSMLSGSRTGPVTAAARSTKGGSMISPWTTCPGTEARARARAAVSARSRRARAPMVRPGSRTSPRASWDTNQAGR
ncbi:hypothetical protein [Asanoa siamensis]|uniref:hypothetical protein n=1 Tax=Asanoa siamensis TaxID=926357 RepID=UPI001EF1FD22|nr:hypothetical protein [Asanoa siamensis]